MPNFPSHPVCYPVWKFTTHTDPYMAAIKKIRLDNTSRPSHEAALIGSVFRLLNGQALADLNSDPPAARHA